MPLIRIPRRAIAQPQGLAEIDWTHPLAQGLTVAYIASVDVDLVSGAAVTLEGSRTPAPVGVVASATGTQKAFLFADSEAQRSPLVSTFTMLRRTATLDPNFDAIGKNYQSSGAPSYVSDSIAYNPSDAGQDVIRANQGVSGAIVNTSNYGHPDTTRWHTAGGTFGDGSTAIYVDGLLRSSVSSGAIVYGSSGDNSFGHNFGGKTGGFEIALCLRWNRILSAAEFAELDANAWQIFRDDLLIGFAAAGGGGSVSLTIADAIHSHAADVLVLSSQLSLTVADASHAHLADNLTLQAGALLAVADATHAHALEAPTLTTQQLLAIADALHAQYADNVSLSNAPFLAIQDATHAHVVDAFALSVQTLLAIQGMQHAHAADGVTLSLGQQLLIVQDMLHTHFADLVALGVSGDLLVALERYTLHAAARQFDLSAKKRRTEISA